MATDDTIDELMARVRKRLRTSDLIEPDFAARDEDVGQLLAVVEHLQRREEDARGIIADGVAHVDQLEAEVARLNAALTSARAVAFEAWCAWDSGHGFRVGKLLKAMAGHLRGYRADIDAIHDATGGTADGEHR